MTDTASVLRLPKSAAAWRGGDFDGVLKQELSEQDSDRLPLQQGLTQSSIALDTDIAFTVLQAQQRESVLHAKVGIFYQGMIIGCHCADDPSPADTRPEYCEVEIAIDLGSGEARVQPLS